MMLGWWGTTIILPILPFFVAGRKQFKPYEFGETLPLFVEQFSERHYDWIGSEAKKVILDDENSTGGGVERVHEHKYSNSWSFAEPKVYPGFEGDRGLLLASPVNYYAVSTALRRPIFFGKETFVLQYEVKFQEGLECGGAYIKLFRAPIESTSTLFRPERLDDQTPYTVMFGPDRCGTTDKVHFIIQHLNRNTGRIQEKHMTEPPMIRSTKLSTLYTLIVHPDGNFEILINRERIRNGHLLKDFNPPINSPAKVDDPKDEKPTDWVDAAKIPDPTAIKPIDWDETIPPYVEDKDAKVPDGWLKDEREMLPDPNATKPESWIDAENGIWEPPMIVNPKCKVGCGKWVPPMKKNPLYKGKWTPPLIDNPAYHGPWKARQIPNPEHFEDPHPTAFLPAIGIGFELWTVQGGILFDNIIITNNEQQAVEFAEATWTLKYDIERLALEVELQAKGISDENLDENLFESEEDLMEERVKNNNKMPNSLLFMLNLVYKQAVHFSQLFMNNPKQAVRTYPMLCLNSILLTLSLTFLVGMVVNWLVNKTTCNTKGIEAIKKPIDDHPPMGTVQQIQKSERLSDAEELTVSDSSNLNTVQQHNHRISSQPDSPSHIPRPVSPVRPLKFNKQFE